MNKLFLLAILALIFFVATLSYVDGARMGGWTNQDAHDPEYVTLFNQVQHEFLTSINAPDGKNTRPVIQKISTQVVAGLNVRYSVSYDQNLYEITVFRDLKGGVSVSSMVRL